MLKIILQQENKVKSSIEVLLLKSSDTNRFSILHRDGYNNYVRKKYGLPRIIAHYMRELPAKYLYNLQCIVRGT